MEDAQQHAGHGQQTEREIVLQERERKRLSINALKANDDRQRLLDQYIALDPPVPDAQFDLITWTLSVFCFMCRISFAVFDNIWFRKFLQAVRPSFEKRMPSQMRKYLSNTSLPQVYVSTKDVAEAKLKEHPGKSTLSIDGHTDGNGRSVTTICILKPNVNVFYGLCWKRNENLATMVENVMADYPDEMLGIVVDNTGNNLAMFEELREKQSDELVYKYLLLVGCCVHILDLLIEDICKISEIDEIIKDANFMVNFVLEHKLFYEEFSILRTSRKEVCKNIRTFSPTRFALSHVQVGSRRFPSFRGAHKVECFSTDFCESHEGQVDRVTEGPNEVYKVQGVEQ